MASKAVFMVVLGVVMMTMIGGGVLALRLPTRGTLMAVATSGSTWVAGGVGGILYASDDGHSWFPRVSGVSITFYGAAYCNVTNVCQIANRHTTTAVVACLLIEIGEYHH
jgi:uncharacterized membrane protein HdeD (DUF308 family)